jgi:Pirin C-terminal cupin domain
MAGGAEGEGRWLAGVPLGEQLLTWWNFAAGTPGEIVTARNAWAAGTFGDVRGFAGDPLAASPLTAGGLKPR